MQVPSTPRVFERHGVKVERVTDAERLDAWADAWNSLAVRAPQRLPRLSHAWVSSLLHHARDNAAAVASSFGGPVSHEPWSCLLASRGEDLVGVLPLVLRHKRPLFGLARRVAEPPRGPRETSGDLLLAPGPGAGSVLSALVSVATETIPGLMSLELDRVYDSSPTLEAVRAGVAGVVALVRPSGAASYVSIRGRYADFFAQLPVALRDSLSEARKRRRELTGAAFEVVDGPDAWRSLDRFAAPESAHHRTLARRLAERGWLEAAFFNGDDRTLAAQMNVHFGGVLHCVRTTHDDGYGRHSPGPALFESTLERVFRSGRVDEVDTGSDHGWQQAWGMQTRPCWNVRLFPRRPLSLLLGFLPARLRRDPRA